MRNDDLDALLSGRRSVSAGAGRGWRLRLLSAAQVLEARREAAGLAGERGERALCANACLLARALVRGGRPVFSSGQAVLAALQIGEIDELAGRWAAFNRRENPSPEDREGRVEALKKAWSTRLTRALSGACSAVLARCPPPPRRGR